MILVASISCDIAHTSLRQVSRGLVDSIELLALFNATQVCSPIGVYAVFGSAVCFLISSGSRRSRENFKKLSTIKRIHWLIKSLNPNSSYVNSKVKESRSTSAAAQPSTIDERFNAAIFMYKQFFFPIYRNTSPFNSRSLTNLLRAINMQHSNRRRMSSRAHTIASKITFHTERQRDTQRDTTTHSSLFKIVSLCASSLSNPRLIHPVLHTTPSPPCSSSDKNAKFLFVMLSLHLSCHVSLLLLFVMYFIARTKAFDSDWLNPFLFDSSEHLSHFFRLCLLLRRC